MNEIDEDMMRIKIDIREVWENKDWDVKSEAKKTNEENEEVIDVDIENEKKVEKDVENCVFNFFACFFRTCRCNLLLLLKWLKQRLHVKSSTLFFIIKIFFFFFFFSFAWQTFFCSCNLIKRSAFIFLAHINQAHFAFSKFVECWS